MHEDKLSFYGFDFQNPDEHSYTAAQEADFLQKRTDSADEIKLMAGAGPASVICPVDRCRSRM